VVTIPAVTAVDLSSAVTAPKPNTQFWLHLGFPENPVPTPLVYALCLGTVCCLAPVLCGVATRFSDHLHPTTFSIAVVHLCGRRQPQQAAVAARVRACTSAWPCACSKCPLHLIEVRVML